MQYILVSFVVLFLLCGKLHTQNVAEELLHETNCQIYDNCDSCIQGENYCVWCFQKNFNGGRCGPKSLLMKRGCGEEKIHLNSENSTIAKIDSDKNFNDVTNPDNMDESVQIRPQKITVKLLPKKPLTFQFKYRLAKNYPLDLYYLMDLTLTMEPDVMTMANLGMELTEVLRNLTQHFRVAFGYYSDKVEMPFSKMTKEFVENPCSGSGQCRRAFDFIHSLNFTNNVNDFIQKINSSKTTANLDNLEGGFDALYQIILCEDQIQWRKNSRRIIVVATDGTLHFAGDGILAGAVRRNANECFLDKNGIYESSLIYDYPSLEEVYHRLLTHKMNVLFAAKQDALKYYENINKEIPSVSYVGKLAEKSTNVLNLVKEGYFNVVRTVKFSANTSDNLKITFQSMCNQKRAWNMSSMCDNVEEGEEYVFNVTLEAKQFPTDVEREIIVIEEQNIAEKLVIEVQYIGKCKCNGDVQNPKTNTCSNHGTYTCGICVCEEGWKGENCEVSCMDQTLDECREKNDSYTSTTCYSRGDCYCGKCICDEDYTGKYCQERQCHKNKYREVCSGPLHGTCHNGKCHCTDLYSDVDCSCSTSKQNCLAPGINKVCSGQGDCKCGKCICFPQFRGEYCELCPTCTGLCSTYEECVLDTLANKTKSKKCFAEDETGFSFVPQIIDDSLAADDLTTCTVRYDEQDGRVCDAQYKYTIKRDLQIVELQIHNECRQPVRAATITAIIIGVILGAGILLILLWKAKLMNDDRREYARFQENLNHSKTLDENPLYRSPISNYQMPVELTHRGSAHE